MRARHIINYPLDISSLIWRFKSSPSSKLSTGFLSKSQHSLCSEQSLVYRLSCFLPLHISLSLSPVCFASCQLAEAAPNSGSFFISGSYFLSRTLAAAFIIIISIGASCKNRTTTKCKKRADEINDFGGKKSALHLSCSISLIN